MQGMQEMQVSSVLCVPWGFWRVTVRYWKQDEIGLWPDPVRFFSCPYVHIQQKGGHQSLCSGLVFSKCPLLKKFFREIQTSDTLVFKWGTIIYSSRTLVLHAWNPRFISWHLQLKMGPRVRLALPFKRTKKMKFKATFRNPSLEKFLSIFEGSQMSS